jgi:hypothetical protein
LQIQDVFIEHYVEFVRLGVVNDLCPLTAPAFRFEVNIGLQVDFPLVQIGFNLYKSRALPVKCVLAVIYKTVSDFIHFSAKMHPLFQAAKFSQ